MNLTPCIWDLTSRSSKVTVWVGVCCGFLTGGFGPQIRTVTQTGDQQENQQFQQESQQFQQEPNKRQTQPNNNIVGNLRFLVGSMRLLVGNLSFVVGHLLGLGALEFVH